MKLPKIATKRAYGDAIGPFGFPMPSDLAIEIETALKTLSREFIESFTTEINGQKIAGYRRSVSVVEKSDFVENERADVSMITSAAVDRDRDVILPTGIDWKSYKKNPVVGYGHNYDILPVGRAMWWKRATSADPSLDGWLAKTQYTKRPDMWQGDWWPDAVWHMIRSGDLRGKSIGFIPLDGHRPTPDEIKTRPGLAEARWILTKIQIVEYSAVGVQSNPAAVVQSIAKSAAAGFPVPRDILSMMGLEYGGNGDGLDDEIEIHDTLPSLKNCRSVKNTTALTDLLLSEIDVDDIVNDAIKRAKGIV